MGSTCKLSVKATSLKKKNHADKMVSLRFGLMILLSVCIGQSMGWQQPWFGKSIRETWPNFKIPQALMTSLVNKGLRRASCQDSGAYCRMAAPTFAFKDGRCQVIHHCPFGVNRFDSIEECKNRCAPMSPASVSSSAVKPATEGPKTEESTSKKVQTTKVPSTQYSEENCVGPVAGTLMACYPPGNKCNSCWCTAKTGKSISFLC